MSDWIVKGGAHVYVRFLELVVLNLQVQQSFGNLQLALLLTV